MTTTYTISSKFTRCTHMRPSSQKTGIAFALLLVFNLTQFTLNRGNEIIIADNNTKKEEIQQAEIIGFCAVPANDENFFLYRLNVYTQTYIYICVTVASSSLPLLFHCVTNFLFCLIQHYYNYYCFFMLLLFTSCFVLEIFFASSTQRYSRF